VTCRTLSALISAAMVWNLPHNILARAKQGDSVQTQAVATNAKEEGAAESPAVQMPAKKAPPKPKAKSKKAKTPPKPAKSKTPPKPAPKPVPKPAPPPPAPKPAPKPAPFFPPAPPVVLPPVTTPPDNSRFQVPLPEEKGELNIWGDDQTQPVPVTTPFDPSLAYNQVGLMGVVNYLGAGGGLEYLRRSFTWMDWGFQLVATQAELSESKNQEESKVEEFINTQLVSGKLTARFFYSRWLYLSAGLGMNTVSGQFGWRGEGVENNKIETDFAAQIVQFDLGLGTQWEMGAGFYLGADWVGHGFPLATGIKMDENQAMDDITRQLTGSLTDERILKELSTQFRPWYLLIKFGYMF
jgi:hypothetical protein